MARRYARPMSGEAPAFGRHVRAEREAAGVSLPRLARASGISRKRLTAIEDEAAAINTLELASVCKALGLTITEFVQRAEDARA